MSNYIVIGNAKIKRQEGDTGDIKFILPAFIDPSNYSFYFQVFGLGQVLIDKRETDWSVNGQEIIAILTESDTKGKSGTHRWELEMANEFEVKTIGKGNFVIINELIKEVRHV